LPDFTTPFSSDEPEAQEQVASRPPYVMSQREEFPLFDFNDDFLDGDSPDDPEMNELTNAAVKSGLLNVYCLSAILLSLLL
jgi:hypothetical protein